MYVEHARRLCKDTFTTLHGIWRIASRDETRPGRAEFNSVRVRTHTYVVVVYLYLTSAKCTGIAAFLLWPEATALTEMVKVELHERKKMKFYNV